MAREESFYMRVDAPTLKITLLEWGEDQRWRVYVEVCSDNQRPVRTVWQSQLVERTVALDLKARFLSKWDIFWEEIALL